MSLKSVINSISNEKGLSKKVIFNTVRESILDVVKNKYKLFNLEIFLDKNGYYKIYVVYDIVNDPEFNISIKNSFKNIPLKFARFFNLNVKIGDKIKKEIDVTNMGRMDLQFAKNFIFQKVKGKQESLFFENFEGKIGKIIYGTVRQVNKNFLLVSIENCGCGILYRKDSISKDHFKKNDRVKALLKEVFYRNGHREAILSRSCDNFLLELLRTEIPEIKSGVIEIMGIARDPGNKSKVSVKSNDLKVDPIGTCIGIAGSRIQNVSKQLCGEKIDLVLWDKEIIKYLINIFSDIEIKSLEMDDENMFINIYLKKDDFQIVNEKTSQIVTFAECLTGWSLNILKQD